MLSTRKEKRQHLLRIFIKQINNNGFVDFKNEYQIEILKHLYGLSVKTNANEFEKSNHLIKHYCKTQKICPLWVIPNGLALGEIVILFNSLPSQNQKEIVKSMKGISSNISIGDLCAFSGDLEIIRSFRNVINHYEPIFPYLCEAFISMPEKLLSIIDMLKSNYESSIFIKNEHQALSINETNYNKKKLQIIRIMEQNK